MRTAVIVVGNPLKERVFQILGKWSQKVQALSAGSPQNSFAINHLPSETAPGCGAPERPCSPHSWSKSFE
jgi:hypothetical protein